ncbi:hypothetical protein BGZ60DRAFT_527501 [Tricladium varicosporioides]|nr:hypothetical protein BGZ60DRAFT_527501 [Hymenoscyphus varicosporioides]
MGSEKGPRPAYVVDFDDETGKAVRGSRRSARTTAEKPKISHRDSRSERERPKKRITDTEYTPERAVVAAASRKVDVITTEQELKLERRKSSASSTASPRKTARPPSAHKNKSFPKLEMPPERSRREDPRHFGIPTPNRASPIISQSVSQPMPQPIALRPRAVTAQTYPTRPTSYHAAYASSGGYNNAPPLSNSAWANYQPPPQTIITPSYPPPNPGFLPHAPTPAPAVSDYFSSQASSAPERPMSARPLSQRFDPPSRTSSGYGYRETLQQDLVDSYNQGYHDDAYAYVSDVKPRRRESIRVPSRTPSRLSKSDADYQAMPPPPRPILRRPVTDYPITPADPYPEEGRTLIRDEPRPRRSSSNRNSVSYDLPVRSDSRPRRSNSHRNSVSYDQIVDGMGSVRIETANNGRRRSSYYIAPSETPTSAYGQSTYNQSTSTGSSGYEDKVRMAASYQEDVAGPAVPLTADLLRKQQRRQAGSSRSTKSSASRDESDYKKSATTRTTRSGSGNDDENVTIKVTGTARVMVGGAQIDCPDGGEIEIKRQQKSIRNGSEQSVSEFGDRPVQRRIGDRERQSRADKPAGRSRIGSQHSYTRESPKYYDNNYF